MSAWAAHKGYVATITGVNAWTIEVPSLALRARTCHCPDGTTTDAESPTLTASIRAQLPASQGLNRRKHSLPIRKTQKLVLVLLVNLRSLKGLFPTPILMRSKRESGSLCPRY